MTTTNHSPRLRRRRRATTVLAGAALLALTACGGATDTSEGGADIAPGGVSTEANATSRSETEAPERTTDDERADDIEEIEVADEPAESEDDAADRSSDEPAVEPEVEPEIEPAGEDASESTSPADPADPEPAATGPVEIVSSGASADKPQHTPAPAPAPIPPSWSEVALDLVEPPAPSPPPAPVPDPPSPMNEAGTPPPVGTGQLVSNQPGCASDCIVSALLTPHAIQPTLGFTIETSVAAASYLWVDTVAPTIVDGIPVPGDWPDHSNPTPAHTWATDVTGLDHDITYHATLLVVDQYGHENWATGTVRTVEGAPDGLVAAGSPCTFQCIEDGFIYPGDDYSTVDIVLLSTVMMADYSIHVSTSEPGWIGDSPILPADVPFTATQGGIGNDAVRGTVTGLAADTTYHVVAEVTDGDGATAHAIGSFRSAPLPPRVPSPTDVMISFQQIHVLGDGDPSPGNRGELSFDWGWHRADGGMTVWSRSEEKIHSNTVVDISGGSAWVSVEPGGSLPALIVNARERDADVTFPSETCPASVASLGTQAFQMDECDIRMSPAVLPSQTIEWVRALPHCGNFGFDDHRAAHRCAAFASVDMGEQFATYNVVVSFHIDD